MVRRSLAQLTLSASLLLVPAACSTGNESQQRTVCTEDMPCWKASTMGNRTGCEQGVWYSAGERDGAGDFRCDGAFVGSSERG